MGINDLRLAKGTWLVANCGQFPSEKNCRLVIMAPAAQRADLVDAAAAHAVQNHGHENAPTLRKEIEGFLQTIEV